MAKPSHARGGETPSAIGDPAVVRLRTLFAGSLLVLAVFLVYYNSRSVPFLMDDDVSITQNPTIGNFWTALSPPANSTVGGRPLLNLSFALNRALNGSNVLGYHVFNVIVHALAALALFGVARRTLLRPILNGRFQAEATALALAVAAIWAVHPVQTESVTYISQRAESLMALFYLVSVYSFIRGIESSCSAGWQCCSILAFLLGAVCKEPIITAPAIIVLYDRTFAAGSFREAWKQRWRYYLGLAISWLILAALMTSQIRPNAGFGLGVTWRSYALTSCRSVLMYLKLAFWPHPLVFDYGPGFIHRIIEATPYAVVLAALLACTVIALRRRPAVGFAGACFFVILAPTSSVIPIVLQPMAENRMYLPLAAVVALVVLGLHAWLGRRSLIVFAAAVLGLGWMSVRRNEDYRSALALWTDTVAKRPENWRAQLNLADELEQIPGRTSDALAHYEEALRLKPDFVEAHNNLGNALAKIPGRMPDALAQYQEALRIKPDFADTHYDLANRLATIPGRLHEAVAHYEEALRLKPNYAEAHNNLGNVLARIPGRMPEALAQYEAALRIKPDFAEGHYNLANALATIPGRVPEALVQYKEALRLNPGFAGAHYNLANELAAIPGRESEALAQYEAALRINPDDAGAQHNIALLCARTGRYDEAIAHFELALKLNPADTQARDDLIKLRAMRR